MANSNTLNVYGDAGTPMTTLSDITGKNLILPGGSRFVESRRPGELSELFLVRNNTTVLYSQNARYIGDSYLKGPVSTNFRYTNIETGQRNRSTSTFRAALNDTGRITRFLGSTPGRQFILKQVLLQGFQPFDETKVYNPASPIIAALRVGSFGLIDRPVRHLDTSNIVGGLLGGSGLGSIVKTVGGLFGGGGPPTPAPPRSSVASEASGGLGLATFTSMLGGGDKSDKVVASIARQDVRDLLRGNTATNAYNAPRYSRLVSQGSSKKGFFGRLLSAVGKFIQNNTLLGGIIPPKQPWGATYRADEKTYDYYLNAGGLFTSSSQVKGPSKGGFFSLLKTAFTSALGLGGSGANYSGAVRQRFYNKSENAPDYNRWLPYVVNQSRSKPSSVQLGTGRIGADINEVGNLTFDGVTTSNKIKTEQISGKAKDNTLKYGDAVGFNKSENIETSDQLLNYKVLSENANLYSATYHTKEDIVVKQLEELTKAVQDDVAGAGTSKKKYGYSNALGKTQQFSFDEIGFGYIAKVESAKNNIAKPNKYTYEGIIRENATDISFPTLLGKVDGKDRFIRPTYNVDQVNSLDVLDEKQFSEKYNDAFKGLGPDLIKFYFHDLVNNKYIPFNAIISGLSENNNANYDTLEYIGRADSLYYYRNFTRTLNFNFKVVAHSVKELGPMWQRINYISTLTKPANYTTVGKFIIPPMVLLNIGDLYKKQPGFITSVNVNIPEDALWETLPEDYNKSNAWNYNLRASISDESNIIKVGQFPRECDIQINMNLIEKEIPQTGRNNFGNALTTENTPPPDKPANFSEKIRVINLNKTQTQTT